MAKRLNINDIIIKPIITEKSSNDLMRNVYTFEVHPSSTKTDIKLAIETIFEKSGAKVSKVNISNKGKQSKRMGRYNGFTKSVKKAIVYLKEGSVPIYGAEGVEKQEAEGKEKKAIKIIDTDKIMAQAEKESK